VVELDRLFEICHARFGVVFSDLDIVRVVPSVALSRNCEFVTNLDVEPRLNQNVVVSFVGIFSEPSQIAISLLSEHFDRANVGQDLVASKDGVIEG